MCFFLPKESLQEFLSYSLKSTINLSSKIVVSLILIPLFLIALLISPLDVKSFEAKTNSKILIFLPCFFYKFMTGRFFPAIPSINVSFAVFSAFKAAFFP